MAITIKPLEVAS